MLRSRRLCPLDFFPYNYPKTGQSLPFLRIIIDICSQFQTFTSIKGLYLQNKQSLYHE